MASVNTALGVDANRILFGASSGYRVVPGKPEGVPVWEYVPGRPKPLTGG